MNAIYQKFKITHTNFIITLYLSISGLFLLAGYNFIRSVSPALFLQNYGKDELPTALFVMSLCLIPAIYLYGRFLTLYGPKKTYFIVNVISTAIMLTCSWGVQNEMKEASYVLFIFKDIYIMILIEQMWSFFNSTVPREEARFLSGFMLAFNSIGPIASGKLTQIYATDVSSHVFIDITWILLIPTVIFMFLAFAQVPESKIIKGAEKIVEKDINKSTLGIREFFSHPQLVILFLVIFITQILATSTELRLQSEVATSITEVGAQTSYFGYYYMMINVWAMVMQVIGTPIAMSFLSVKFINIAIPVIHTIMGALVLVAPSLTTISAAAIVFKTFDYSLFRIAKEVIYIPMSFDVRYRSKQIIDVFAYRCGKGYISLLFSIGKNQFAMGEVTYSLAALGSAACWIFLGVKLGKTLDKKMT